jgi:hypothetical protein
MLGYHGGVCDVSQYVRELLPDYMGLHSKS